MNRHITREHELIRQARLRLKLSQQQVATFIGVHIRQYQRFEYGETEICRINLGAGLLLCTVLELDPYVIIFGPDPKALEDIRSRRPRKGNLKKRR